MGVSSLAWVIAIHSCMLSRVVIYVVVMHASSYNNAPGEHSDCIYVTVYMQLMVTHTYIYIYSIYLPILFEVVLTKPYIYIYIYISYTYIYI